MGTFTVLDADQVNELASAFDLGDVRASRAIAAGTINSNFAIETTRGSYFLRINEGKSEHDVAWEAQLVSALAERGVVTPKPLVARDGRPYAALSDKWVSAFAWRAGEHLDSTEVTATHAEQFGTALAELHVAGLALPADWRRTSIYDHAHLLERFATIERVEDPLLVDAKRVLREELEIAGTAAPVRRAATHGIIHGDLFRDNVLWDGGRISAILDFEQASGGSLAYDLAVCINDWCWTETIEHIDRAGRRSRIPTPPGMSPIDTAASDEVSGSPRMDIAAALLAGYRRARPLSAADREALPYEIRAAAARFTITRITDVYLAKVANPAKDFRAFLARCYAWRSPALRALTQLL